MDTIRLIVCIAVSVPCGLLVARISDNFVTERPLFQPSSVPGLAPRVVAIVLVNLGLFLLLLWRFESAPWSELVAYLLGFAVLLLASVIDITEYRLPDAVVLPALAVGCVVVIAVSLVEDFPERIRFSLLGALLTFGVLLIAHVISPRGMGFGDVKFAALLGLMVGWQASGLSDLVLLVLWLFLFGFATGTVGGLMFMVLRGRNTPFPFGPFLAFGTLLSVLFSRSLVG